MTRKAEKIKKGGSMAKKENKEARELIMKLTKQHSVDLVGLRQYIGKHTDMGRKPNPTDRWTYTKAYLALYNEDTDPQEVISLIESKAINSDVEVGRWLLLHDELVP
jgi:hypothetical protein